MIPIPATNSAIILTENANNFTPPVNALNVSISESLDVASKSFSFAGGTFRTARNIPITSSKVLSYSVADGASTNKFKDVSRFENFCR